MYSVKMSSLLPPPSRLLSEKLGWPAGRGEAFHVVCGPPGISRWALQALCPLLDGPSLLYWVDAANRFDAHALAKAAQEHGMDPRQVLSKIQLARTFNAFQLADLVVGKLPQHPWPVVIADPLAPFYDEDLDVEDAHVVFERFRLGLADIPGPVLALLVDRSIPRDRDSFSHRFLKSAESVIRVGPPRLLEKN
jgi:hypothetical protein